MLEILQFVTSSFGVFLGSFLFTTGVILSLGWAANAILIGLRGTKCGRINLLS